jgi:hypothetical protein
MPQFYPQTGGYACDPVTKATARYAALRYVQPRSAPGGSRDLERHDHAHGEVRR